MDKFICIGKNYFDHAIELGEKVPEKPVLFLKPPSSSIEVPYWGAQVVSDLPKDHGDVHHECEIIARIGKGNRIDAVSLGIDLTLRDLQKQLKKNGHPWEISKVFKGSAIVGPWIAIEEAGNYLEREFFLSLDGRVRQQGKGKQMTLKPQECLEFASIFFPICEGDILYTGTPAGVGSVCPGQKAKLDWGKDLSYTVQF